MKAVPKSRYIVFVAVALAGCAVDLATKRWAFDKLGFPGSRGSSILLIGEVFGLTTSLNEGALFGLGQGKAAIFAALSAIAALGILYWLFVAKAAHEWLLNVALAAVMGGILGNLYDRLGLHGLVGPAWSNPHWSHQRIYAVRDWLHFRIEPWFEWPIFNVADSLLVCGAALLVWHALFHKPAADLTPAAALGAESTGSVGSS